MAFRKFSRRQKIEYLADWIEEPTDLLGQMGPGEMAAYFNFMDECYGPGPWEDVKDEEDFRDLPMRATKAEMTEAIAECARRGAYVMPNPLPLI